MNAPENGTFVRVRSHRATQKLVDLLGHKLDWHWNVYEGNSFVLLPDEEVPLAVTVTGVTRARPKHKLLRCWT